MNLLKATGLWSKTSGKTGRPYLVGRLGALRVLVFENKDAGEGDPTHLLMFGPAEDKRRDDYGAQADRYRDDSQWRDRP